MFAGLFLLSFSKSAFNRFSSLNQAYSSVIILKKCMKVKMEIGLCLLLVLFMPVVYNLVQSVIRKLHG
jgi:hypothetical protein